jgi:uncharacterized ferritin-like protein (DUF455 family)
LNPPASTELRRSALAALCLADPAAKCAAVHALYAAPAPLDARVELAEPPGLPGRPQRPTLVAPAQVPWRAPDKREGRAALLHALAHIEFNAINLALDAVWRFSGLPGDYYADWLRVADEEATHFALLLARLAAHGHAYGDFDAHDGLWEMARATQGDVLARMALVPRTLEARGLDASPAVRAKLARAGDTESAAVLDVILRDEIGHVAVGNRWFRYLCAERGLDPVQGYQDLARRHRAPRLRGPFNVEARLAAGFLPSEIDQLLESSP